MYKFKVGRIGPHFWEEPPISGDRGSGAIFFSGCTMQCAFCQNYVLSHDRQGVEIDERGLEYAIKQLVDDDVHNINLVTPTPYVKGIASVLSRIKKDIPIPIVYNTSAYESVDAIKMLDGLIDIYLPDYKYADDNLAIELSSSPRYSEIADNAIREMRSQRPLNVFDKDGIMKKGIIVRHLILPGYVDNSLKVMERIANIDKRLPVSVMSQYFPTDNIKKNYPTLNRRITEEEYAKVMDKFYEVGLTKGYTQDVSSAIEDYVPDFSTDQIKYYLP